MTYQHTWWRWLSCHTWQVGRRAAGWSSGSGSSLALDYVCHGKVKCRKPQDSSAHPETSPLPAEVLKREIERTVTTEVWNYSQINSSLFLLCFCISQLSRSCCNKIVTIMISVQDSGIKRRWDYNCDSQRMQWWWHGNTVVQLHTAKTEI